MKKYILSLNLILVMYCSLTWANVCQKTFTASENKLSEQEIISLALKNLSQEIPDQIKVKDITEFAQPNAMAAFSASQEILFLKKETTGSELQLLVSLSHEMKHLKTYLSRNQYPHSPFRLFIKEVRPWTGPYSHGFSVDELNAYVEELLTVLKFDRSDILKKEPRFKSSQYIALLQILFRRIELAHSKWPTLKVPISAFTQESPYEINAGESLTVKWDENLKQIDLFTQDSILSMRLNTEESKSIRGLKKGKLQQKMIAPLIAIITRMSDLLTRSKQIAQAANLYIEENHSSFTEVGSKNYFRKSLNERRELQEALAQHVSRLIRLLETAIE